MSMVMITSLCRIARDARWIPSRHVRSLALFSIMILTPSLLLAASTGKSGAWLDELLTQVKPESSLGLALMLSLIGLVPGLVIALTSFARIIIVLTFVRQGVGLGDVPPQAVLTGMALFLTYFTMAPAFDEIQQKSILPLMAKAIAPREAIEKAVSPLATFMLRQTSPKDLSLFVKLSKDPRPRSPSDISLKVLIPAFVLSELKTAFLIGILILLPFVMVDLVVAVIAATIGLASNSLGNVTLVLKLALFTSADGWNLIVGSLVRSFN